MTENGYLHAGPGPYCKGCGHPLVLRALGEALGSLGLPPGDVAHPGFAVVEILELCTAYATRWNPLTGAKLRQVAEEAGYELGVLRDEPRPTFAAAYAARRPAAGRPAARTRADETQLECPVERPFGLVLAGTAGEHVQTAATILARAALSCGLHVTQKNDNPVTQGTGFSVSEVIVSEEPILYTGSSSRTPCSSPPPTVCASSSGTASSPRSAGRRA
jgi:hypothetical protein